MIRPGLFFPRVGAAVFALVAVAACATPTATLLNVPTRTPSSASTRVARPETSTAAPSAVPVSPTAAATQAQTTSATAEASSPPPTSIPPTAVPPTEVPPPTAPSSTSAPEAYFGVNTNGELLYNDQQRALAILGGVQMVRTSVDWSIIERTPGEYNWKSADGTLKILFDNNFVPLVLILNNAEWASNSPCGPANDLLAFDRFVRELGARYPRVKYWMMYNEPDNGHFPEHVAGGCFGGQDINGNGKADVQDYAEQLRIAWKALHDSNPNAQLVLGALAMDNFDEATAPPGYPGAGKGGVFNAHFMDDLLKYMQQNPLPNGKYFDVWAFNYYDIYGPYWEQQVGGNVNDATVGVGAKTKMIRGRLHNAGFDVPLLIGETGVNSYNRGSATQTQWGIKTFVRGLANDILHVVWWTWQDYPDSNAPPSNTWKYGLIDQDAQPKPIYAAFQTASNLLTNASYLQPIQVQGGEGYLFDKNGAGIGVVWSSSENPVPISFAASTLQVTDVYGAQRFIADGSGDDQDTASGRIGIQVGMDPSYVQVVQ